MPPHIDSKVPFLQCWKARAFGPEAHEAEADECKLLESAFELIDSIDAFGFQPQIVKQCLKSVELCFVDVEALLAR